MISKEIYFPIKGVKKDRKIITAITYDNECWFCTSHAKDKGGYCKIHFCGYDTRVHRVIYTVFKGRIPNGMVVRHTCDHPDCINPEHLVLGTQADNARDRKIHGCYLAGEKVSISKLKEREVYDILSNRSDSFKALASKYNVAEKTIRSIKNGKSWKHVYQLFNNKKDNGSLLKRMPDKPPIKYQPDKRKKEKTK